tara:strand:+ start:130 stop:321 length:192 start_codon:yes stop_codon:yes gene_type:complete
MVMEVETLLREAMTMLNEAQDVSYAETDLRLKNIETLLWAVLEEISDLGWATPNSERVRVEYD